MSQKEFIKDIAIVILGAAVLVGGYFMFLRDNVDAPAKNQDRTSVSQNETADWNICDTSHYFYMEYPKDWKVWKRGVGEAVPASCNDERLKIFIFSPDIYQYNNLESFTVEVSEGDYDSLDAYFSAHPQIKNIGVVKETVIDGKKAVWLKDRVLVYHDYISKVFDIRFSNLDENLLDKMLGTFKFVYYRG